MNKILTSLILYIFFFTTCAYGFTVTNPPGGGTFTGGTLTSKLVADETGIEFQETDTLTDCSTFSATGGGIFYDDSEGVFKKCQDNVLTVLDASGAGDLLADGTVPLTANWDVGAFTITGTRFISDIATGIAPFAASSTTKVTNLNVDQLDGGDWASPGAAIGTGTPVAGTFTNITTSSSATPTAAFTDSDTTDEDISTQIVTNCTDTGSGTEDCDMTFSQQIAGVMTAFQTNDADGNITFSRDIVVSGSIQGTSQWGSDIIGAVAHNTTDLHSKFYLFTAAATVTLDAAADAGYGAQACYRVRDAAEAAIIDVDAAEKINLSGTATSAGEGITATGAGESVCVVASTDVDGTGTDGYYAWGPTSGWDEETP